MRLLEPHLSEKFAKQQENSHKIDKLREYHMSLSNKSKLALLYMEQVSKICSEHEDSKRFEKIRIYHKWLQFVLRFVLDYSAFYRERITHFL